MGFLVGLKNVFKLAQMMGSANTATYKGAGHSRRLFHWRPPQTGPNDSLMYSQPTLVNRSRDFSRNDPWGSAIRERHVTNIVGTGIKPKSMAPTEEDRERIQEAWLEWTDEADADEMSDFYGMQEVIANEWHDAGECFSRFRFRRPTDGLSVPLQIQLLETEQIPINHNTVNGRNIIRAGIERNPIGKRVAYWMYREHPGEFHSLIPSAGQLSRVPANEIQHIYQPLRAGQLRGVPTVTPILARMHELNEYDDATVLRQWIANLFVGFIKKPTSKTGNIDPLTGQIRGDKDADGVDISSLEPGTMYEMPPGFEVDFNNPPQVESTYEGFMRYQLMASAAAVGMSYAVLSGDLRGINDRLLRALLHEFRRRIRMLQHHQIVFQWCRPVWARWMDMAVFVGRLKFKDYEERRKEYLKVRWVPESWPYLHPVQDVQAAKEEILAGLNTRAEHVSERGGDVEQVDRENAQDQDRADKYRLRYSTDFRAPVRPQPGNSDGGALGEDTEDDRENGNNSDQE
jgi:lambda family phage portal protein